MKIPRDLHAKKDYEKEEKKKERAKARGEDTWMLASVNQRLEQEQMSLKKTKKKKDKKKSKKKKRRQSSSSSDSESDSEEEKRKKRSKKKKKRRKDSSSSSSNSPGTHAKEMNPYWKDGGTGLPDEKPEGKKERIEGKERVGDAGLSWLQKSYERCVEQAKEEGRSLEELAAERWGYGLE
ncbi:C19L2-like protein [Mya arenaria]|uniref:C19L2-like protein n=1 Tax=Mya arenaria TaxID=6604 RepID=A0ABY7DS06_MYAAR|nr:C19L2-like protein [Mya arenaria]